MLNKLRILCIGMIVFNTSSHFAQQGQLPDPLHIRFENATDQILPGYLPYLYLLADSLRDHPELELLIRGHVCCVNRNGLARKRARVVYKYLLLYGVEAKRMKYKGYKNKIPVVYPELTKEDEQANMRVDFIFSKKEIAN